MRLEGNGLLVCNFACAPGLILGCTGTFQAMQEGVGGGRFDQFRFYHYAAICIQEVEPQVSALRVEKARR